MKASVYAKKTWIPAVKLVLSPLTPSSWGTFWKPGATTAATASSPAINGEKPWNFNSRVQSKKSA